MRGKLTPAIYHTVRPGITPADAGKTKSFQAWLAANGDHPRGCGENDGLTFAELSEEGSPPRMRGKPTSRAIFTPASGITPADAGKTLGFSFPF